MRVLFPVVRLHGKSKPGMGGIVPKVRTIALVPFSRHFGFCSCAIYGLAAYCDYRAGRIADWLYPGCCKAQQCLRPIEQSLHGLVFAVVL